MSKVAQVVRDALLHLRAIDQHQTPEAQEVEDAIRQMNMLVREWEVNSLPLGWVDVANPDEDVPCPPEAESAIAYNLALRLQTFYGISADPSVVGLAASTLAALTAQAQAYNFARLSYDDLPVGQGRPFGNWREGYYR